MKKAPRGFDGFHVKKNKKKLWKTVTRHSPSLRDKNGGVNKGGEGTTVMPPPLTRVEHQPVAGRGRDYGGVNDLSPV